MLRDMWQPQMEHPFVLVDMAGFVAGWFKIGYKSLLSQVVEMIAS